MSLIVKLKEDEDAVGARLRELRLSKGLTQTQLGVRSGSNQATIQKIENGHSTRPRNVVELAVVLEVNPAWLIFGDLCASKEMPRDVLL